MRTPSEVMSSDSSVMPDLPVLQNDDSMLSRKFGKEVVNYYAGGTLNRISFLRTDPIFLRKAALSPHARFLALSNLSPLVSSDSQLAQYTLETLKPLIGADPFELSEKDLISTFDSTKPRPLTLFLGLLEGAATEELPTTGHGVVKGEPFFAVDVTPKGAQSEAASAFLKAQEEKGHTIQANPRGMTLSAEGGMFSPESIFPPIYRITRKC